MPRGVYPRKKPAVGRKKAKKKGLFKKVGVRNQSSYEFTRFVDPGDIKYSGSPTTLKVYQYALGSLVDATDFQNLFERFTITRVRLQFNLKWLPGEFQQGSIPASPAVPANCPVMYIWNSYDDADTTDTISTARQQMNCKTILLRPDRFYTHWVKPACIANMLLTTTSTTRGPMWNKRIDLQTGLNTPHYGTKIIVDNLLEYQEVRVTAKYYFTCSGVR